MQRNAGAKQLEGRGEVMGPTISAAEVVVKVSMGRRHRSACQDGERQALQRSLQEHDPAGQRLRWG